MSDETRAGGPVGEPGAPTGPEPAGPYPAGPYPAGPYPHGPHPAGPFPPPPGQLPPLGGPIGWAPPTEPPRRRRRGPLLLLAALVAVLVLVVVAVVVYVLPPSPEDAVVAVSGDVRGWEGVTYRGAVAQPGVGPVTVEVTTNAAGDRSGVLTRPDGGRAEYAEVRGVPLVNGDASWWSAEPLGRAKALRLAGYWVRVPPAQTSWLGALGLLSPPALADDLAGAGAPPPAYSESGEQAVDGADGRAIEWPGHRVLLSDERTPRLLTIVPAGSPDPAGLRVTRASPEALTTVADGPGTLSSARGYDALLYAPTDVVAMLPGVLPDCATPTCSVTFTLRNGGIAEARGVATLTRDSTVVGRRPFRLAAGASAPFTITEPNPAYALHRDLTARLRVTVAPG